MRTERVVLRAERLFGVARVNPGIESVLGRERRCLGGLVRGEATFGGLTAWGFGFEVSGQQAKTAIKRGFAKQSAELASSLILKDGNEGAAVKYNRLDKKDHSVKDSSDFWGVFGFNLMQKESEMSMMQVILAEIPAPLRNSIMEKLNIMYTICAIHPDLQLLYISRDLNGLIAKSSPEQIEHYQQQYLILCNLIQESIPYMSPSICLDFLRLMQANKFYSHPISVGLFNNMYSKRFSASADLSDQDFCKSIDYLNLTLKRYILPASDPTDWGVARQLMSELMNYNNMNYMLDRSIEFLPERWSQAEPLLRGGLDQFPRADGIWPADQQPEEAVHHPGRECLAVQGVSQLRKTNFGAKPKDPQRDCVHSQHGRLQRTSPQGHHRPRDHYAQSVPQFSRVIQRGDGFSASLHPADHS